MKKTVFRSEIFLLTLFLSSVFLLFVGSFLYKNVYRKAHKEDPQIAFDRFLDEVFTDELESDPISLHFLVKDSSVYGIQSAAPVLTPYSGEADEQSLQRLTALRDTLATFPYEELDSGQQQTYDCLLFLLDNAIALSEYHGWANPVSPYSGIQQQLPLLLSEYRFDSRNDIDNYLSLLDSVYAYFESLCAVLSEQLSQNHIPAVAIQKAAEQCFSFLNTAPEDNVLLVSFRERLSGLEHLDEITVAVYEMKNRYRIETEILPAYRLICEMLSASLPAQTSQDAGLSAREGGREYYTLLAQNAASTDRTVPQMKELLTQYYNNALAEMKRLAAKSPYLPQQALDGCCPDGSSLYDAVPQEASEVLVFLQENTRNLLPSLDAAGELQVTVKTVSPCLQKMSAPAMYLLAPLDAYREHTVYLNPAYSGSSGYLTLAHETFPGHLSARVCFLSGEPHPLRSFMDFGGWDEGWASLAELYAYGFLPAASDAASQDTIRFLCAYEVASLCLYGLSDIGIHYDGWGHEDTLSFWTEHGTDEETADMLWSLVVSEPAYYLPYSLGLLQMLELRETVSSSWEDNYSEAQFCSSLLSLGPMPYPVCKKYLLQYPAY